MNPHEKITFTGIASNDMKIIGGYNCEIDELPEHVKMCEKDGLLHAFRICVEIEPGESDLVLKPVPEEMAFIKTKRRHHEH